MCPNRIFLLFLGNHDELIKNPDGAYSQLIRLQEGSNKAEAEEKSETDKTTTGFDLHRSMSTSGKERPSVSRSMSKASSGRHLSLSLSSGLPTLTDTYQSGEGGDGKIEHDDNEKQQREVSMIRLAYLNKPEIPILLLGSVAAAIHGVVLPVFGLLLSSAIHSLFKPPLQMKKESSFWGLLYVVLGLISLLVLPVQNSLFGIAGGKLIERIRSSTFEKVVHQEISWFDNPENSR